MEAMADDDRNEARNEARYVTRFVALIRLKSGDVEAVCTSLSLTGGFLACEAPCKPGDIVEVSILPPRLAKADVDLVGDVIYVVAKTSRGAPGIGLRWRKPKNPEPLTLLLKSAALRESRDPRSTVNFKETLVETPGGASPISVDVDGRTSTDTQAAVDDGPDTVQTSTRRRG